MPVEAVQIIPCIQGNTSRLPLILNCILYLSLPVSFNYKTKTNGSDLHKQIDSLFLDCFYFQFSGEDTLFSGSDSGMNSNYYMYWGNVNSEYTYVNRSMA